MSLTQFNSAVSGDEMFDAVQRHVREMLSRALARTLATSLSPSRVEHRVKGYNARWAGDNISPEGNRAVEDCLDRETWEITRVLMENRDKE